MILVPKKNQVVEYAKIYKLLYGNIAISILKPSTNPDCKTLPSKNDCFKKKKDFF